MSASAHFRRIFAQKNLRLVYLEKIRDSQAIGLDRMRPSAFAGVLAAEVKNISRKVMAGKYSFTRYKQKLITKGAGKFPRVLSIPTVRDRVVLRALCDFLQVSFENSIGEMPQQKIDQLAKYLVTGAFKEYIRLDLQDFYGSIDHSILNDVLATRIKKKEIRLLLDSAVKTPTVPPSAGKKHHPLPTNGVPQGLAISNLLAEIAIGPIDALFLPRTDIKYIRYVDDILILVPLGQSSAVAKEVIDALIAQKFRPHSPYELGSKSKIGPLTESFVYLGYQIQGSKLGVREETKQRFESGIASILTAYRHRLLQVKTPEEKARALAYAKWHINLKITGCISEGKRKGWVFYFSQINDMSVLSRLQHTIEILIARHSLSVEFRPKTLLKSFREAKRKDKAGHAYIPNFDEFSVSQMRDFLKMSFSEKEVAAMSIDRVRHLFKRKVRHAVKELEADMGHVS